MHQLYVLCRCVLFDFKSIGTVLYLYWLSCITGKGNTAWVALNNARVYWGLGLEVVGLYWSEEESIAFIFGWSLIKKRMYWPFFGDFETVWCRIFDLEVETIAMSLLVVSQSWKHEELSAFPFISSLEFLFCGSFRRLHFALLRMSALPVTWPHYQQQFEEGPVL